MLIFRFSILAILLKLNHDDLLKKTCQFVDLLILTVLIIIFRSADFFHLTVNLNDLCAETALTYALPLVLSAGYNLSFIRSNIGSGDILFLYAVAPLAPGIKGFQLLFIASILALPFALLKYFKEGSRFKVKYSDYSFPFIPFLTVATFVINI